MDATPSRPPTKWYATFSFQREPCRVHAFSLSLQLTLRVFWSGWVRRMEDRPEEAGRHGERGPLGETASPSSPNSRRFYQTSRPYLKRFVTVLTVRRLLYTPSRCCVKNGRAHANPLPSEKVAVDHTHPMKLCNQHRSAILKRLVTAG